MDRHPRNVINVKKNAQNFMDIQVIIILFSFEFFEENINVSYS